MWILSAFVAGLLVAILVANLSSSSKKVERKIEHLYGVRDPDFLRSMGSLLGPPIVPGNRVTALCNGDEIFPAMLEAIRGAAQTICFETFIYWSGSIGREFAEALSERARAGVTVVNGILVARFLGGAVAVRVSLAKFIAAFRSATGGFRPVVPRLWTT